jgi:tRNA A-37 threonylcarbamoyl transferase component Bud32
MRDIHWLIENVDRYKEAIFQKRFTSKKNVVAYVLLDGQPRILKWFVPGLKQNMEKEFSILKKGVVSLSVPSPFEKDIEQNVLVLSYIPGQNVCDIINDPKISYEEKIKTVQHLAEWFLRFHTFFKTEHSFQIRGDATLRNFIQHKGQIWGVDFEESRIGKPSEDLATLCSSLLSTDPMFTDEKYKLCQGFLDAYRNTSPENIEHISAEIAYALLERIQWRPNDEETLRKHAARIRSKGLLIVRHNF